MAINVGDIAPLRLIRPFSAVEEQSRCLVLSTSPLIARSITGDPDMDRVIGPTLGDQGVTYQQTLTTGVTGALWQIVDVQRLTQNFLSASVNAGNLVVAAGVTEYVPLTQGNTSEDLSSLNNVVIYGDSAEAVQPADGLYFTGAVLSMESSVGAVIAMLELVTGSDLNRPGEIVVDVPGVFHKRVTAIGEPESIPILASHRIEQGTREIGLRISHDQAGPVTFTFLNGGNLFTRQQAKM